jgi:hypothetical protein
MDGVDHLSIDGVEYPRGISPTTSMAAWLLEEPLEATRTLEEGRAFPVPTYHV